MILVCSPVLELVKVLETTPNVLVDPRVGAVAASTGAEAKRNDAHHRLASKPEYIRLNLEPVLVVRVLTCSD